MMKTRITFFSRWTVFCILLLLISHGHIIGQVGISDIGSARADTPGHVTLDLSGDLGPYTITLDGTLLGTYGTSSHRIDDLSQGEYTVLIKDRLGCETSLSFVIDDSCDGSDIIISRFQNPKHCDEGACYGRLSTCSSDGWIELHYDRDDEYQIYVNDVYQGTNVSLIENLSTGVYKIETIGSDGCKSTKILELKSCKVTEHAQYEGYRDCIAHSYDQIEPLSEDIVGVSVTPATEGLCNGAISVDLPYGYSGYVHYHMQEEFHDRLLSGEDLCPGQYTIFVYSGCGCNPSIGLDDPKEYNRCDGLAIDVTIDCVLTGVDIEFEVEEECGSAIVIESDVNGTSESDIIYRWTHDEEIISTSSHASYDGHGALTLEIESRSRGCIYSEQFVYDGAYVSLQKVVGICPISDLGEAHFIINNPEEEDVKIYIDGNLRDIPHDRDELTLMLYEGSYNIRVDIDDCSFIFDPLEIGKEPVRREFLRYDEEEQLCVYQKKCNDQPLPSSYNHTEAPRSIITSEHFGLSGVRQAYDEIIDIIPSILDIIGAKLIGDLITGLGDVIADGIGWLFGAGDGYDCSFPVACDNQIVGEMDDGTGVMRVWEFLLLTSNLDLNSAILEHNASIIGTNDWKNKEYSCRKVRFCKQSLIALNTTLGFPHVGSICPTACGTWIPTITNDCRPPANILIHIAAESGISIEVPEKYCEDTRDIYLSDAYEMRRNDMLPNDSELYQYLDYIGSLEAYGHNAGICVSLLVCFDDFSIIGAAPTKGEIINKDCGSIPPELFGCTNIEEPIPLCGLHALKDECKYYICEYQKIEWRPDGGCDYDPIVNQICPPDINTRYKEDFEKSNTQSRANSLLTLSITSQDEMFDKFFIHNSDDYVAPGFISQFDPESKAINDYLRGDKKYRINNGGSVDRAYKHFDNAQGVYVDQINSEVIVLLFNDNYQYSAAGMRSSAGLQLIDAIGYDDRYSILVHYSDSLWLDDEHFLHSTTPSVVQLEYDYQGKLLSNRGIHGIIGDVIPCHHTNGGFVSSLSDNRVTNYSILASGQIGHYDISGEISVSSAEGADSYLLHLLDGDGSITIDDQTISISDEQVLLVFDTSGALLWYAKKDLGDVSKSVISISESSGVAYWFYSVLESSQLTIDQVSLSDGSISKTYSLESTIDFSIKSAIPAADILYFGGELQSPQGIHSLGEVDFLNLNNADRKKAYVSYITLD